MEARESPWRNPVVWLLVLLPLASVFAGVGILVAASRSSGSNDEVPDRVSRTGQAQVADLAPSGRARALGLGAVVRASPIGIDVVPTAGAFDRAAPLRLSLRHPLEAAKDAEFELQPSPQGWHADGKVDLGHDWNARLQPEDGSWRIDGRWPRGQRAVFVRPAVPGP